MQRLPRCPNCNYELVLLEKRRKYKCPKCGKLFPQREIEDAEFREWNKKRKKEAKEYFLAKEKEEQKKKKRRSKPLSKEEWEEWMRKKLEKARKRREENRDEYNAQKREYWAKNRKRLLVKRKENFKKRKPQIMEQQRLYRQNNKTLSRIKHLRNQQKLLALKMFEINQERALNQQINFLLPTFVLSYLLRVQALRIN